MTRHLLFFYGTLMSGKCRGNVLTGRDVLVAGQPKRIDLATRVGRGSIRGVMHDVAGGAFPGVVAGDRVVHGEVWECPTEAHLRAALGITDSIEGYRGPGVAGNLYDRVEVPLLSATGNVYAGETVLTYFYNADRRSPLGPSSLGPIVESGDWREYEPEPRWRDWATFEREGAEVES